MHIDGVARLEPQDSAPSGASMGDLYVHDDGALCLHTGAAWQRLNATGTCP